MSGEDASTQSDQPVVSLTRLVRIATYEVMQIDLERLDELVANEMRSLTVCSFTLSLFMSVVFAWLAVEKASPVQVAAFTGTLITSGVLSLFFGLSWNQARKARPRLIDRIKSGMPRG